MDYREQLLIDARKAVEEMPGHRGEIIDLFTLAVTEIEDGESSANEYELFTSNVDALRKELLTTGE